MIPALCSLLAVAALATGAFAQCMCSAALSPCTGSELIDGVCVSKPLGGTCETYHCDVSGFMSCSLEESNSCLGGLVVRPKTCAVDTDCEEDYACRPTGQCAKIASFQGWFATDDSGVLYLDGKKIGVSNLQRARPFNIRAPCGNLILEATNENGTASFAMLLIERIAHKYYRTGKNHGRIDRDNKELTATFSKVTPDMVGYKSGQAYDFSSWRKTNELPEIRQDPAMKFMYDRKRAYEIGNFFYPDVQNYTKSTVAFKIDLPGCDV